MYTFCTFLHNIDPVGIFCGIHYPLSTSPEFIIDLHIDNGLTLLSAPASDKTFICCRYQSDTILRKNNERSWSLLWLKPGQALGLDNLASGQKLRLHLLKFYSI